MRHTSTTVTAPDDHTLSPTLDQLLAVAESRLRELEPVETEIARLRTIVAVLKEDSAAATTNVQQIAALLGDAPAPAPATVPSRPAAPPTTRRPTRGTKPGRDGRAPQGANKALIMDAVERNPGIKTAAVAELTGLKRTVVSATVNRLKHQGELETVAGGLQLVRRAAAVAA